MKLTDRILSACVPYVIYGAQVVAYGAYKAIEKLCGRRPECFVVSSLDNNPKEIEGLPVRTPEDIQPECFVVVAVTELLQAEIISFLTSKGFRNIFALTQHEEHLLMKEYYESTGRFPTACIKDNVKTAEGAYIDFTMYEVKNHRDKQLSFSPMKLAFEKSIQAGADLTNLRIAELCDNTGENISNKNKQYCEMSAVYWIWKNTKHEWVGIEHYRRHLMVKPEMLSDGVDAILPLPYMCYPNTASQFRRFVSEDVLLALLKALQELHPRKYNQYKDILYGQHQYTYNMLCAKRQVFEDYCSWFFEITECMEEMSSEVPEIADTRALSYVAEVLTNIYFMSNADRWNIQHVEKEIYT